jgi:RNA polymerase sigma-70 factor (ECF subfamily)
MEADLALLERWRDGDREAGQALITRHFAAVRRFFANKISRDPDDLAQSTFLRCVERRDAFEGRSSFRTFLFAVARNVLFEHYRAIFRDDFEPTVTSVADLDPTPSQLVSDVEWQRRFYDALRAIPVEMQALLELYYWEGLSTTELADVFDTARGTIKSRLFAARGELRDRCLRSGLDIGRESCRSVPGWARDLADLAAPTASP